MRTSNGLSLEKDDRGGDRILNDETTTGSDANQGDEARRIRQSGSQVRTLKRQCLSEIVERLIEIV